jgi:peptide chain release factor subunit 1
VIIAGPGYAKQDFLKEADNLDYRIRNLIVGEPMDVAYQGVVGLREVVMKAKDVLTKQRFVEVFNVFEEFKYHIAKDDGYVVYGPKDVEEALNNGAVEKLLICDDHPEFERLEKLAEERGSRVVAVPSSVDEYQWFKDTFACVAAITRYPLAL